jgi:hypothetical protein
VEGGIDVFYSSGMQVRVSLSHSSNCQLVQVGGSTAASSCLSSTQNGSCLSSLTVQHKAPPLSVHCDCYACPCAHVCLLQAAAAPMDTSGVEKMFDRYKGEASTVHGGSHLPAQHSAAHSTAAQGRAGQGRAGQGRAGQGSMPAP